MVVVHGFKCLLLSVHRFRDHRWARATWGMEINCSGKMVSVDLNESFSFHTVPAMRMDLPAFFFPVRICSGNWSDHFCLLFEYIMFRG